MTLIGASAVAKGLCIRVIISFNQIEVFVVLDFDNTFTTERFSRLETVAGV